MNAGGRKKALVIAVVAGLICAAFYAGYRMAGPEQGPPPPGPENPIAAVQVPDQQEREQLSEKCAKEASELIAPEGEETEAQRAERDLNEHWIAYLAHIQAAGDFPNWTGPPCSVFLNTHRKQASDALAEGLAKIEVSGKNLQFVTLHVTAAAGASVALVVPAGTLFTSDSSGAQNMVAAESVTFNFITATPGADLQSSGSTGNTVAKVRPKGFLSVAYRPGPGALRRAMYVPPSGPRSIERDIPTYCVNRWLSIPDEKVEFSVSAPDTGAPVQQLVSCLENRPEPHEIKQLAVWMVSDDLLSLSRRELEDKFLEHDYANMTLDELATLVLRAKMLQGSVDAQDKEALRAAFRDIREKLDRMAESELEEFRRQLAQSEAESYIKESGPLLRACGVDLSRSELFPQ